MKSKKCPNCGLVSFETQIICKRCNVSLNTLNSTQENPSENWTNQVLTRNQEILFGILALLAGLFLLIMNWMSATNSGKFYAGSTIMAPFLVAIGLCLIVFPFPEKEHFPKAEYAPKTWAIFLVPSFILGAINWAYFMGII
ncbi:MAG: hypothetical protein ACR2HG_05705 [Pyrinomonadaceae bacterium]